MHALKSEYTAKFKDDCEIIIKTLKEAKINFIAIDFDVSLLFLL